MKSNGKAEAAVKVAKVLLTKAQEAATDPYLMLLEKRNTASADIGYSPVQRLHGRRTRTLLPTLAEALVPKTPDPKVIADRLVERQTKQKHTYDIGAKDRPELSEGDDVWVECVPEHPNKWLKGKVKRRLGYRSYDVEVDGVVKRRNRIHLRKRQQTEDETSHSEDSKTRSGRIYKKQRDVTGGLF